MNNFILSKKSRFSLSFTFPLGISKKDRKRHLHTKKDIKGLFHNTIIYLNLHWNQLKLFKFFLCLDFAGFRR